MGSPLPIINLLDATPRIAPSLLACDFGHLATEVHRLEEAEVEVLHLDVMDGHFVPNLSFGIPIVQAVRRLTDRVLDVHLMISEPHRYLEAFRKAGADLLTIHIETVPQPVELLERIRQLGAGAGLSLNPPTPVAAVEPFLDHCDLVLVMSVMPGFGGQSFEPVALDKLRRLKSLAGDRVLLSVDGGVDHSNLSSCVQAGAGLLVMGTAFFRRHDYSEHHQELMSLAQSARDVQV
jgi:ribulose-phosphate 3-epimerase